VIKILHILATPRGEGTPNLVLDWLNTGLHHQEVFALDHYPPDLTPQLSSAAQWYGASDQGLLKGWKSFLRLMRAVTAVCSERQPDVVICWVHGLSPWICLGAWRSGVRRILVHAGNPPTRSFRHDWLTRYANWPLWLLKAKVVCCSRYVCQTLQKVPFVPEKLFHVVYNCSRAEKVQQRAMVARAGRVSSDDRVAIMVATLERHKDHATLLHAVPEIVRRVPSFKLLLAGDGSLRQPLELMAREMGKDAVCFLGSRQDVPELLGSSDLFVFSTTDQEGLGSVLLEAMAAGLPIVASDVPACREVLKNGLLGELVPPSDPQAMADKIVEMLNDKGRTESLMSLYDIELAGYAPPKMIKEYLALVALESTSHG